MIRIIVACMLVARLAYADDVVAYEAEGGAPAQASDARIVALDDAFARAVASALADLVAGDVRTAHQGELAKEIIGHARLWVARFTVTKDQVDDDRRELSVSVLIDRDKLRARLDELKVATHDSGAPPDAAGAPTATVLLRVTNGTAVRASFGKGADRDVDGLADLTARLHAAGYAMRRAPVDGPAPSSTGDYPDVDADALADAAQADVVAIASVTVGEPLFVRGQAQPAVLATARVRLVDHKSHQALGQGAAIAAAPPDAAHVAIGHALASAAADALPIATKQLAAAATLSGDEHPLGETGVILVRMAPATRYPLVLAEQRYLAGAKGVRAATLRRLSPAGWVIGVATSDPIDHVAQIAKKPPATDTSAAVKIVGDVVEIALSGPP